METICLYTRAGRPCYRPVADLMEEVRFDEEGRLLGYRMVSVQPERRPQGPEDYPHLFIESGPEAMFDRILAYLEREERDEQWEALCVTLKDRYSAHLRPLEQTSERFRRMNALAS